MSVLQRLEVWSSYQCDSGTRTAIVPLSHLSECVLTTRTTREDEGRIVISKEAASYSAMTVGAVLRFLYTDATFEEWRIIRVADESQSARLATVTLRTPLMELATGAAILSETTSGVVDVTLEWKALAPSDHLTKILTFCPTFWAAGTVTPTIPCDLSPSGWMPLQALRALVSAIRAQGVNCELDFRRNGTSGYYLDLVSTIGASAGTVDVRTAKNLLSTRRTQDRERYGLEVVPIGASSATMARAWIEVTNKAGTTLTVQQPVTGGAVIAFDNQFDGLYWIDDAGAKQSISSCSASAQTLVVASAANVTSGRWYRLAKNSSGDELVRVRKAESTAGPIQVVTSSSLGATTNLVGNPAMRVWTGGAGTAPDGWTKGGGAPTYTKTQTTGFWVYGGQSCRIQATAASFSLQSPSVRFYVPTWATSVTLSCWGYWTSSTGAITVNFQRDASAPVTLSTTDLHGLTGSVWQRMDYTASLSGLTGAVHDFYVLVNGNATCDFYVDSVQVTLSASAESFVEGSDPARLLSLANRYLTKYSTVPASYQIEFADLASADPTGFPYDAVTLGQTANVRDTDLGITTSGRVLDFTRDFIRPGKSALTVSTRTDDVVSLLTGIAA